MLVRFWGTRGSIATPGPTTLRYGGNTSCVEVRSDNGTIIVLDCGTGAHGLGQDLASQDASRGHLLISHTHWDHIQGFPFFKPLFLPGNQWEIYGPGGMGQRLEATLSGQMEYTYFPVTLEQLAATIRYHDLVEGTFEIGDVRVGTRYLNHPAVTLGYRLQVGGATVVYATDHEPHSPHQAQPEMAPKAGGIPTLIHVEDQKHAEFLADADLVIHDSQYLAEEYAKKVGWGHSTAEYVVDLAVAGRVRRLVLFHHDPLRTDNALDGVLAACRERARSWESPLEVLAASEGDVFDLPESPRLRAEGVLAPSARPGRAVHAVGQVETVLVVDDEPDIVGLLMAALRQEGYRLLAANDGESALRLARAEIPSLILLDWQMPGMDGLEVCRTLRSDPDPVLRQVPVIMLTARARVADTEAGFAAGVSDYITKPFTPAHVRTRVRQWLLRARAAEPRGGQGAPSRGTEGVQGVTG